MPQLPDPAWKAFWRIDPRPDGSPAPDGPLVHAFEDKIELIAAGQAVALVPAGIGTIRPDPTTVPCTTSSRATSCSQPALTTAAA
jgi:hypothetical protein